MARPSDSARVPLPITVLMALGALGVAGTCLVGIFAHHRGPRHPGIRAVCVAPTRTVPSMRTTADAPVTFDVDRDGVDELIALQTEAPRDRFEFGQQVFVVALSPARETPLWRARVENAAAMLSRNSSARAHLVRLGDRALYLDLAGHLRAIDLATGAVVARAELPGQFARVCAAPDNATAWFDGVLAGRHVMVNPAAQTLSEPRPAWCPDVRARSPRCPAFANAAACRGLSSGDIHAPEFRAKALLTRAPFTVALGTREGTDDPMAVGLDPDTFAALWSRSLPHAPGSPARWGSVDRGDILGARVYLPYPVHGGFRIAALDASTGAVAWDVPLPCSASTAASQNLTGISATLTRVYVQSAVATVALDVNTGAMRWMLSN